MLGKTSDGEFKGPDKLMLGKTSDGEFKGPDKLMLGETSDGEFHIVRIRVSDDDDDVNGHLDSTEEETPRNFSVSHWVVRRRQIPW